MDEEATQGATTEATDAPLTDVTAEPTAEVESPTTEQSAEEVTEEDATSEDTKTEQTQTTEEQEPVEELPDNLAPKSENRFRNLVNERNALKKRVAELEELSVPTEQDYIDGGYDPVEAKLNALEANMQQDKAINQVIDLNKDIDTDMVRIIHEYPALNPKSPEFNKDLAINLFQQYDVDSGAKYTEDGITLETKQLPYDYIKSKMNLVGIASQKAQVTAQKNVEQMVAQAETQTAKVPPISNDDSLEAMRERLANVKF